MLIYTCDYLSESARRGLGAAADICLSSSKFTDLDCTLASILSSAADFITVGYGAYDLGNDHTRQILRAFLSKTRRTVFTMEPGSTDQMPRHPFLDQPLLYVNGLPEYVRDQDIAQALEACVPFRPQVVRDGSGYSSGNILFKSLERGG